MHEVSNLSLRSILKHLFAGGYLNAFCQTHWFSRKYIVSSMRELNLTHNMPELLGFPGGSEVKASASNVGDPGLIPGSGRSPGEEMVTHYSILAWRMPWTEEPSRLQSMGLQESDTT